MKRLIEQIKKHSVQVDTNYRIGLRVVKTSIAVMLCLLLSAALGGDGILQISAISALVTLRASQHDTMHQGVNRVLGTIIGGLFGMVTVLIGFFIPFYDEGMYIVVIPLMLVLNLFVCNIFQMRDACSIACVVLILVASQMNMDATVTESLVFTALRTRDTLIGVIVSSIIDALPVWKIFDKPS